MKRLMYDGPKSPNAGRWLNPVHMPEIFGRSPRLTETNLGIASFVLTGGHLVVSTIPCDDHLAAALSAGIELDEVSPFYRDRIADMRGFMSREAVLVEFWRPDDEHHPDNAVDDGEPIIDTARLDRIIDAVRSHPRIQGAFVPYPVPEIQVGLLCSYGREEWRYRESSRRLEPDVVIAAPNTVSAPSP